VTAAERLHAALVPDERLQTSHGIPSRSHAKSARASSGWKSRPPSP
jgi:hypothetical protein